MEVQILEPSYKQGPLLREFYGRVYRADHPLTNEEFLVWWLHKNPFYRGEGFSCKIAVVDGQIIGHYGYLPVSVVSGDVRYQAVWGCNLVVDERYRGQGIASLLVDGITEDMDMGVDIGASPVGEKILVKRGWVHLGSLTRYAGVLDFRGSRPLIPETLFTEQAPVEIPHFGNSPLVSVKKISGFGEAHNLFWDRGCKNLGCTATDRTARFLNWRYTNHPLFRYWLYEARSGSELLGFAVMRLERVSEYEVYVARIVEFFCFGEARFPLLARLVSDARVHGAVLIDFFCAFREYDDLFNRFGFFGPPTSDQCARLFNPFVPVKHPISFNVCNRKKKLNEAFGSSATHWYVTSGDSDQDRPN